MRGTHKESKKGGDHKNEMQRRAETSLTAHEITIASNNDDGCGVRLVSRWNSLVLLCQSEQKHRPGNSTALHNTH